MTDTSEPSTGTPTPPRVPLVPERVGVGASREFHAAYDGYSRTLRTWLVAYGIGAPVLLMTNDSLWRAIAESGDMTWIGALFLIGVALQVLLATLNKTAMWVLYYGEIRSDFEEGWVCSFAAWLSRQFWIDILVDLLSMGLFAAATYQVFRILTAAV